MAACPRCRSPQPVPPPKACVACGEVFAQGGAGRVRGPRLAAQSPEGLMSDFPLGQKTTLGRHPGNSVRLVDREVSKEHAAIEKLGTTFVLKDLGSSNGTFVNGRRVKELRLKDGDEISLGSQKLTFHAGDEAPVTAPGVTVVGSAQSIPAFLAQIDQAQSNEFKPVSELQDQNQIRQDYEKLRIAHEFHRQVGLERDQKGLLDKILGVSFQLLAADTGVIFLPDEHDNGTLAPRAVKHRKGEGEVVVSDTVLTRVAETRQAVLTADAIIDSRFSASESIVAQGIRSAMAVPLLSQNKLKGILFLDTRERANAFSEKDLKILAGIASQAAIALENAELALKIEREAVARAELSRFLSPAVADLVVKGQVEMLRTPKLVEVSVLFADIRGFTTMSESEDPQETVSMLNSFFSATAEVIFRHEGNLDKFIGDCVMAVWGPPSAHPDDPARALRAALEMQEQVDLLNERRKNEGKNPIQVGIGINTGTAVVGYMGSQERHEFTAIGDSVNIASRICGLAKGGEVLATEHTVKRAGPGFESVPLPVSQVKGKEKGVATYRIVSSEETSAARR